MESAINTNQKNSYGLYTIITEDVQSVRYTILNGELSVLVVLALQGPNLIIPRTEKDIIETLYV